MGLGRSQVSGHVVGTSGRVMWWVLVVVVVVVLAEQRVVRVLPFDHSLDVDMDSGARRM